MSDSLIGRSVNRHHFPEKLTGDAKYSADLIMPGMLSAAILRSPHPHANILGIDTSEAEKLDGVKAIITPFNVPLGKLAVDLLVLDTRVRFVGDEVAAVAAVDIDTARRAIELIDVRYEILPYILNPDEALLEDAIKIHEHGNLAIPEPINLERGDIEKGFSESDEVFEDSYHIPAHSAAALEPRAALAYWEKDHLTIWKSTRGVHVERISLSNALQMPSENIRIVGPFLGGGFGNKDETRLGAISAVLAQRTGLPVRLEYSREEEFVAGRTRHASYIDLKIGFKRDGTITAIHGIATLNSGAYQASTPQMSRRTGQCMLYLYDCPNVKYESYPAYTNCPTAGSYRALGAPQGHFALETLMDQVAEHLGIDQVEFRRKNHVKIEGQQGHRISPDDQIIDSQPVEGGVPFSSNELEQCLIKGAEAFDWVNRCKSNVGEDESKKYGSGVAIMIYRGGPGYPTGAEVRVNKSGEITVICGLMDVGEGMTTVLSQMCAEVLGVEYTDVATLFGDTRSTPDAPITSGSTATFSAGTAVIRASNVIKDNLLELAAAALESEITDLVVENGYISVKNDTRRGMTVKEVASLMPNDYISSLSTVNPGSTEYIVNSFGAHFVNVEVDTYTGNINILKYVAAHDSGVIINPQLSLNQVEGGISQMLGLALSEELVTDENTGVTLNGSYLEHKCPTILDYPNIQVIFADSVDPVGPMGAKALGEVPSVGVGAAVANAVYDAIGVRFNSLPITPDKIIRALYN